MPLLDLLPPSVKAYITSPEGSDDLKLAEALGAGDVEAAKAAFKSAVADSPIPEPFKSLLDSDAAVGFFAPLMVQEVQDLKSAVVG